MRAKFPPPPPSTEKLRWRWRWSWRWRWRWRWRGRGRWRWCRCSCSRCRRATGRLRLGLRRRTAVDDNKMIAALHGGLDLRKWVLESCPAAWVSSWHAVFENPIAVTVVVRCTDPVTRTRAASDVPLYAHDTRAHDRTKEIQQLGSETRRHDTRIAMQLKVSHNACAIEVPRALVQVVGAATRRLGGL